MRTKIIVALSIFLGFGTTFLSFFAPFYGKIGSLICALFFLIVLNTLQFKNKTDLPVCGFLLFLSGFVVGSFVAATTQFNMTPAIQTFFRVICLIVLFGLSEFFIPFILIFVSSLIEEISYSTKRGKRFRTADEIYFEPETEGFWGHDIWIMAISTVVCAVVLLLLVRFFYVPVFSIIMSDSFPL